MNFKKFISGISALTIAASVFAGMAVTASAAVDYEWDVANATWDAPAAAGFIALKADETAGTYVAALPDDMATDTIYLAVKSQTVDGVTTYLGKEAGADTYTITTSDYIYYNTPARGVLRFNYKSNTNNAYKNGRQIYIATRNAKTGNYSTTVRHSMPNDKSNYYGVSLSTGYTVYRASMSKDSAFISSITFKEGGSTTSKTTEALNDGKVYVTEEGAEDDGAAYAKAFTVTVTAGEDAEGNKDSYVVAVSKKDDKSKQSLSSVITGDAVVGILAKSATEGTLDSVTTGSFNIETYLK